MDFTTKNNTDHRDQALASWLQGLADKHQLDLESVSAASSDASFRRYFRIASAQGTVIAMDAPPQQENSHPFVDVTRRLQQVHLNVPDILAQDLDQGFLLLTDLGVQTYYQAAQQDIDDMQLQKLYRDAIAALVTQQSADTTGLPQYDQPRLLDELSVFSEWYAKTHRQATLNDAEQSTLAQAFATLTTYNAQAATVFVHRDFHSPNLIVHQGSDPSLNPGIIDYQDAVAGPITYDIASLVMDARTTWEEAQQLDWAIRYWEAAKAAGLPIDADFADFHTAYEWMSLQRNLRVLGVFARLSHRDGKHHYLDHIPRVNAYVRQVATRYGVFRPLLRVLDRIDDIPVVSGYTF